MNINFLKKVFPSVFQEIKSLPSLQSPCLLIRKTKIKQNIQLFKKKVPYIQLYYAIKANSHPEICQIMNNEQIYFETASIFEINALLQIKIPTHHILYGNPIKPLHHIQEACSKKINWFVCDHMEDLLNIYQTTPQAQVFLRIQHNGQHSAWPLSFKFGANEEELDNMLSFAKKKNLPILGLSFHVGSQQTSKKQWHHSIQKIIQISEQKRKEYQLHLPYINLGGGLPSIEYQHRTPLEEYLDIIRQETEKHQSNFKFIMEPGRSLIASSGILLCHIISIKNSTPKWIYIDCGIFNGLMEGIDNAIQLHIKTPMNRHNQKASCHLAGPTCDSLDIIHKNIELPQTLQAQDPLLFINAGAYTSSYSCHHFNGFPPLQVHLIN